MELRIKQFIEDTFKNAPRSGKALELRDEMEQNLLDKYADLVAAGRTPDEAYAEVVDSVGDVSELFAEIERDSAYERQAYAAPPQTYEPQPQYEQTATVNPAVEEFVQHKKRRRIAHALNGAMWCILVALYFIISFATMAWHITWVMFLIGAAVSSLIGLVTAKSRRQIAGAINGAMWCLIVTLYFVISFATMAWYITWVIFLIGSAISTLIGLIGKD